MFVSGSIWHKIKKTFGAGVDSKAAEHKDQFVALVRELKAVLRADGKLLSIALLPHVNSTGNLFNLLPTILLALIS